MDKDDRFFKTFGWLYAALGAAATTVLAMLVVEMLTEYDGSKAMKICWGCWGALATLYGVAGTLFALSVARSGNRNGKKRKHHKKANAQNTNNNAVNSSITTAILAVITTLCLTSDISLTDKLFTSVPFGLLAAGFGYDAVKQAKESIKVHLDGMLLKKKR